MTGDVGAVDGRAAALLVLAALPGMTPTRLLLTVGAGPPHELVVGLATRGSTSAARVAAALGREGAGLVAAWRRALAGVDPSVVWQRHVDAGIAVSVPGAPSWPAESLEGLRAPPLLLCARGDLAAVSGPRVAVVGTRSCTRYGRDVARSLGHDLASAGVHVVSGLALGVDGEAHEGALDAAGAAPVAVVAGGLDRVYPPRHRQLWRRVAEAGVVLGEVPLGVEPVRWRFPARNRLLAALADVTVVVESKASGGSLVTADVASSLQRHVLAVPGPVHAPCSVGTNDLLAAGAGMCRGSEDVLAALGMTPGARPRAVAPGGGGPTTPPVGEVGQAALAALEHEPATLEQLVLRTGLVMDDLVEALAGLQGSGRVVERSGWFERRSGGPPSR